MHGVSNRSAFLLHHPMVVNLLCTHLMGHRTHNISMAKVSLCSAFLAVFHARLLAVVVPVATVVPVVPMVTEH